MNIFKCKPQEVHFTITNRVPYNKLLTNLACSSRTGEYWPSVVFVRTSLRSVRTATTSGQYSPVRPSRSVSKRLLLFFQRDWLWVNSVFLYILNYFQQIMHYIFGELCTKNSRLLCELLCNIFKQICLLRLQIFF